MFRSIIVPALIAVFQPSSQEGFEISRALLKSLACADVSVRAFNITPPAEVHSRGSLDLLNVGINGAELTEGAAAADQDIDGSHELFFIQFLYTLTEIGNLVSLREPVEAGGFIAG